MSEIAVPDIRLGKGATEKDDSSRGGFFAEMPSEQHIFISDPLSSQKKLNTRPSKVANFEIFESSSEDELS